MKYKQSDSVIFQGELYFQTCVIMGQNFFFFLVSRTFTESFHSLCPQKPWVTKLSSAGLVYLHFGHQLLAQLTQLKENERQLEVLYDKVTGELGLIYYRARVNSVVFFLDCLFCKITSIGESFSWLLLNCCIIINKQVFPTPVSWPGTGPWVNYYWAADKELFIYLTLRKFLFIIK